MNEIEVYSTIIAAILGLAYPIFLQLIGRLDEKYFSVHIVHLFDLEKSVKRFKIFLISSLVTLGIWTLKLEPLFQIEGFNYLIDNSASILCITCTTILVILFFNVVNTISTYSKPAHLINDIIRKYKNDASNILYFQTLADIFIVSLKKQEEYISGPLRRFFYDAFKRERDKPISGALEYPDDYYSIVYKAIEELASQEKRNLPLEREVSGSIWLLGELQGVQISTKTYSWMWHNLLLLVQHKKDEMVLEHWKTAHQYYSLNLEYITPIKEDSVTINQSAIDARINERKSFLQFHYFLGSLLLYKKRYSCLNRIFRYTTSQPPRYELLPTSMNTIFDLYSKSRGSFGRNIVGLGFQYPFPEADGLGADGIIAKWFYRYLALLFIRQYSIYPYLSYMKPLDIPSSPVKQAEKKDLIDGLDFFKKQVSECLKNNKLMVMVGYDFLTEKWCEDNGEIYPFEWIDKYKKQLMHDYLKASLELPLSEKKISAFVDSSIQILENTFKLYEQINNPTRIEEDYNKRYIVGERMVQSKDAFSETSEVAHLNYDSFLAGVISKKLSHGIALTFLLNKRTSYLLKPEELFKGVEKFAIDEGYVIISFGIFIENYIQTYKVDGLTLSKYKNSKLISYNSTEIVRQSLFILREQDLPNLIPTSLKAEDIEKYSLKPISKAYEIYASVIDLNRVSIELRNENSNGESDEDLKKSVLLTIALATEIRWKNGVEMVQLLEYSEYRQNGLPNTLDDLI